MYIIARHTCTTQQDVITHNTPSNNQTLSGKGVVPSPSATTSEEAAVAVVSILTGVTPSRGAVALLTPPSGVAAGVTLTPRSFGVPLTPAGGARALLLVTFVNLAEVLGSVVVESICAPELMPAVTILSVVVVAEVLASTAPLLGLVRDDDSGLVETTVILE